MISLYTRPPQLTKTTIKELAAEIIGKKRGPRAVLESLTRGLQALAFPHVVNPLTPTAYTHVLSGVQTLKYAIKKKRQGKIEHLIAGPAIGIAPDTDARILLSPEIDLILLPSQWVKDFYISCAPSLEEKIRVWPAGVQVPKQYSHRTHKRVLVYVKNEDTKALEKIKESCTLHGYAVTILTYGSFKQETYFSHLYTSDFMIYMSNSESQGIALQEAWVRNVPTLVYSRGYWEYGTYRWNDTRIGAPYLTYDTGSFFSTSDDIPATIASFITSISNRNTRALGMELSDEACAKKYIDIIGVHEHTEK